MVRKKKLRKDRVILVGILLLLVCFGVYKGIHWTVNQVNALFQTPKQESNVEEVQQQPKSYIATVVLDPGHGGYDVGANRSELYEKDISLKTAMATAKYLDQENIKVIFTRESDIALHDSKIEDLRLRAQMSQKNNAQYFVSIHVNDYDDASVSGFEVYQKDDKSHSLAQSISQNIETLQYSKNRGIQDGKSLMVLRENTVPSVLVEIGYIKGNDYYYLSDDSKLDKIGESISKGIVEQIKK